MSNAEQAFGQVLNAMKQFGWCPSEEQLVEFLHQLQINLLRELKQVLERELELTEPVMELEKLRKRISDLELGDIRSGAKYFESSKERIEEVLKDIEALKSEPLLNEDVRKELDKAHEFLIILQEQFRLGARYFSYSWTVGDVNARLKTAALKVMCGVSL